MTAKKSKPLVQTTETSEQEKKIPSYYIFSKDGDGNSQLIGAAFKHNKGDGFSILIGEQRLVAFPPKEKTPAVGG